MKVMVVDDATFMRRVYADIVAQRGHELIGEASTGKEAIEKYKHLRPDLIIMDVVMPDVTGLEAVKEILSYDSDAKVIIVTGAEDENIQADALSLGARGLVFKPPDVAVLGDLIDRLAQEAEVESPKARMATIYTYLVRELLQYVRNYFDADKEGELEEAFHAFVKAQDCMELDQAMTVKLKGGAPSQMNQLLNRFLESGREVLSASVGKEQADDLFKEAFKLVYQHTPSALMDRMEIMFPPWLESEVVRMYKANWEASLDLMKKRYGLKGGAIYMVQETKPEEAFKIFSNYTLTGSAGLVLTRSSPKEMIDSYKTGPTDIIWLTYNKVPDIECIEPSNPGLIYKRISEFVKEKPNSILIFDGLEYIISQTSFSGAQKLIQAINDEIMLTKSMVLIPIDVDVLDQQQVHFLSRELKVIRPKGE